MTYLYILEKIGAIEFQIFMEPSIKCNKKMRFQTNTCVYMNKKLEFCGNAVRCQVYEMWSQGDRVACGVITDDTKV